LSQSEVETFVQNPFDEIASLSLDYMSQFISENHPIPFLLRANEKIKAGIDIYGTGTI
jgi:hypothetical protein